MSEIKELELVYNLKQDVDFIVRQLNQQNRLISRMRRFQCYCKDFLDGTNQIGIKRLDLEYANFDRDYQHLNRVCQKMNRKMCASLIYDKISNLFFSLSEGCAEIDAGDGARDVSINDNIADDENDDNSGYMSGQSTELNSDEFDEDSSDVFVGKRKKPNSVIVNNQQSTPNKRNKSGEMVKCDIVGCQFVTKSQSKVTRHKLIVHKISNRRLLSDPLCHFTRRQLTNLTRQGSSTSKSEDSSTAVKKTSTQSQPKQTSKQAIYRCDLSADCTYVTDQSKSLKHHQWIHSAKQLYCDYDGCDFHTVKPGTLEFHRKRVHNRYHSGFTSGQLSNFTRQDTSTSKSEDSSTSPEKSTITQSKQAKRKFRCDFGAGCTFVTKYLRCLKEHQWIHSTKQINCDFEDCDYLTTRPRNMVAHQMKIHNLFPCGYRECRYVGKRESDLKVHRTKIHKCSQKEIRCPVGGCEFVTKLRYDLLRHQTIHVDETSKNSLTSLPSTSKIFSTTKCVPM